VATNRTCKIFVNLPVRDLARSIEFFTRLGFAFNPKFTDDQATCMILSQEAYVMLLVEKRFQDFARKPIGDATRTTEGILAITVDSRAEVDELVNLALTAGATRAAEPQDHGFMYAWSFYDPDGHHWEVFWMDPAAVA
jgi:uncharacterized protein